ncbi:unnamed protein product, partial [Adineta ricciae]
MLDKDRRASLISSCSKTITQYKFDLMASNLDVIQSTRYGHEESLQNLQNQLSESNANDLLKQAIEDRRQAMTNRSADGIKPTKKRSHRRRRRRSEISIYKQITASTPFIQVDLKLTSAQMSMSMNGFKYVVPYQSQCSPKPIERILTDQYENTSFIVKNCLQDHRMSINNERSEMIFAQLRYVFKGLKSHKVPKKLTKRAQKEYQVVRSIRRLLRQRPDIVVRRTDKNKVFYIGKAADFDRKAEEFMLKTEAYAEITSGICPLAENLKSVKVLLDYLLKKKALTRQLYNQLCPKEGQLELGHFHGLPKPHKPGTPIRPIIASMHAPATLISKFLNDLLAPVYLQVTRDYTLINDIDVVRRLEEYAANGYITPTTKFITIDVENLYTMIPRQGALCALARFCMKHSKQGKIGTLALDHIMKMARLILDTNCFAYNNKYYRQIRGGAMGSAFTQVLANIYMFEWEQDLIEHQQLHHGMYGRYIDDIFMTTDQSIEEINIELEKANNKDINIKISTSINTSVHFLDVTVSNESGHLRTSIYHKPTTEPYVLPYTSDHPRHIYRNIPYAALLRAARICSTVEDFHSECIRTDMSLLLNKYPPRFITEQFQRFFQLNDAISISSQLNKDAYQRLHQTSLHQSTRREKKLNIMMYNPIENPLVLQPKVWNKEVMYPRYLFDSSITKVYSNQFYNWWKHYYAFPTSPLQQVKVILVTTTNPTLDQFFIHKKPPRTILRK